MTGLKDLQVGVFSGPSDFYQFENTSKKTKVYCSEIVEWITEYRIYVIDDKIIDIKWYEGEKRPINLQVVKEAIKLYSPVRGYGIDFGLLKTGETALIEFNDGYSLGNYGMWKKHYADLIIILKKPLQIPFCIFFYSTCRFKI